MNSTWHCLCAIFYRNSQAIYIYLFIFIYFYLFFFFTSYFCIFRVFLNICAISYNNSPFPPCFSPCFLIKILCVQLVMPANETRSSLVRKYMRVLYANISVFCTHIYACFVIVMCVKNTHMHASKRHTYIIVRLKCLVKNIHWKMTGREHNVTNVIAYTPLIKAFIRKYGENF